MPTKGERGKATDFSIAAIMAPRGPSFGHYHLQGIGNAAATANTSLECPAGKGFVAEETLDNRESGFFPFMNTAIARNFFENAYFFITTDTIFVNSATLFLYTTFNKREIIKLYMLNCFRIQKARCFFYNEKNLTVQFGYMADRKIFFERRKQ